jgi:hypothetical protein
VAIVTRAMENGQGTGVLGYRPLAHCDIACCGKAGLTNFYRYVFAFLDQFWYSFSQAFDGLNTKLKKLNPCVCNLTLWVTSKLREG